MTATFRTFFSLVPLVGALTLAGCSAARVDAEPKALNQKQLALLDKQLGGKIAGQPTSCLATIRTDQPIRVSDGILLYRVSNRLVYRNDLPYPCHGLARGDDIIVTRSIGAQQCDGDLIRLVDRLSGIDTASCSLGQFTPYRTPEKG